MPNSYFKTPWVMVPGPENAVGPDLMGHPRDCLTIGFEFMEGPIDKVYCRVYGTQVELNALEAEVGIDKVDVSVVEHWLSVTTGEDFTGRVDSMFKIGG